MWSFSVPSWLVKDNRPNLLEETLFCKSKRFKNLYYVVIRNYNVILIYFYNLLNTCRLVPFNVSMGQTKCDVSFICS